MKFKIISNTDVKILREAFKILKTLQTRENKLREDADELCTDSNDPGYAKFCKAEQKHNQLLDELYSLHIVDEIGETEDELTMTTATRF